MTSCALTCSQHLLITLQSFLGKLIGTQGSNIELIRRTTHCEVSVLRPHEYSAALSATYCNDSAKYTRQFIRRNLIEGPEPPRSYDETQVQYY